MNMFRIISAGSLVASALVLCLLPTTCAAEIAYHLDPAKVMGAAACGQCHAAEVAAWQHTHHFLEAVGGTDNGGKYVKAMHRRNAADKIARNLSPKKHMRMKHASLCMGCHYTVHIGEDGSPAVISGPNCGVSCESCHGAASDWIKVHSVTNNPDALIKAAKLGMIRPSDYYHLAANCFSCHTVPNEKLVNTGGHKAGSDFELVSWLSGEVRHNLQKSGGKVNAEIPKAQQRMLYIIGRAVDLEYSLRGMAKATVAGAYSKAMKDRINKAMGHLNEIEKASGLEQVKQMIAAVNVSELKPGNAEAIDKMADAVQKISIGLANSGDGTKLASIDSLIPGPDKYMGTPYKP